MNNVPFSDLIQNGKFIGDLAVGLLSEDRFPASVQPRAVEYQALALLAHEKGIAVNPLKTRAELEDALKIDAAALATAVERVGKEKMPFEVPRFGDVLSYEGADLVPGEKWTLSKDIMDNLLLAQTAGRVVAGIVPAFAPRFDEAKDDPDLVSMQKALFALKESNTPVPDNVKETAQATLELIYTQLGGAAYASISAFMDERKNPIPFSDLVQNGKFIGDLAAGLLTEDQFPTSVQPRAIEYQALTLLAHEKGIAVKPLKTRAELEGELKLDAAALAAAVERVGKEKMPFEVPRFGDVLSYEGADLVPGRNWALTQETTSDLLMLQSAGRVAAGIVPAFAPRVDEANDDPNLVILQKALLELKEHGTAISPALKKGALEVLALTAEQVGPMAQNKVAVFTRDLTNKEAAAAKEAADKINAAPESEVKTPGAEEPATDEATGDKDTRSLLTRIYDNVVDARNEWKFKKDLKSLRKAAIRKQKNVEKIRKFREEHAESMKLFNKINPKTTEGRDQIKALPSKEKRLYNKYQRMKGFGGVWSHLLQRRAEKSSAKTRAFYAEAGHTTINDTIHVGIEDFIAAIDDAIENGFTYVPEGKKARTTVKANARKTAAPAVDTEAAPANKTAPETPKAADEKKPEVKTEEKAEKKKRAWYNIPGRIIDGMFEKKFRNDLDKLYDVAVKKEAAEAALDKFRADHPAFKDLDLTNAEQVKGLSDDDKKLLNSYESLLSKSASIGTRLQKTAAKNGKKAREFYAEAGKTTIKEPIKVPAGEFIDAIERAKAESYGPSKPNFLQRIYNRLVPAKQEKVRQEPVLKTDEAAAPAEKPAEATAPSHVRDPQHPETWASRLPERPDTPVAQPTTAQPPSAVAQPVAQPPVAPVTATAPAAPVTPPAATAADQPVALTARQKMDAYWDTYKANLDRLFAAEKAEKELKENLAETRKRVKPEIAEAIELAQLEKDIAEQAHENSRDDLAVFQKDLRAAKGLHRKGELTTAELKEWVDAARAAEDLTFEKLEALEAAEEKLKTSHLSPELENLKAAYKAAKREVIEANTALGVTTPKTKKDNTLNNLKGSWSKHDWAIAQREWKGQPHNRPETPRQRAAFDAAQKPKLANG